MPHAHQVFRPNAALKATLRQWLAFTPRIWSASGRVYPPLMRFNQTLRPAARKIVERIRPAAIGVFHDWAYLRHNARRQEHLATLGLDLSDKSVLEVAAGIGDHTTFFLDRGCQVTSTEPRAQNLDVLRRRFLSESAVTVESLDLDGELPTDAPRYDVVYCYGALYHLSRPAEAIAWMCDRTEGLLLLETCVSMSTEDSPFPVNEIASSPSQAITGIGCRPSRVWVMNRLKEKLPYVYVTVTQPWHEEFPLDWTAARPPSSNGLTRAVFVASRNRLDLPSLSEELPITQRRC